VVKLKSADNYVVGPNNLHPDLIRLLRPPARKRSGPLRVADEKEEEENRRRIVVKLKAADDYVGRPNNLHPDLVHLLTSGQETEWAMFL